MWTDVYIMYPALLSRHFGAKTKSASRSCRKVAMSSGMVDPLSAHCQINGLYYLSRFHSNSASKLMILKKVISTFASNFRKDDYYFVDANLEHLR